MKKIIALAALVGGFAIAGALGGAEPAKAAYCDQSSNGCEHANPNALPTGHVAPGCNDGFTGSGAGGFGFQSGQGNNQKGGADGQQTGLNNSALCGNRNGEKNPS